MRGRLHVLVLALLAIMVPTVPATAQIATALRGMTVSDYSISATASLESPSSLAFTSAQNTSPGGMDPSLVGGLETGDGIEGTDWSLAAGGVNFNGLAGSLWNLITVETGMSNGASHAIGDTVSGTFTLVFADDQRFLGTALDFGVDIDTATLTKSGGTAVDLTTTAGGTLFTAGTYTLIMDGTVNADYTGGSAGITANFTNVSGAGGIAAVAAAMGLRRRRR